MSIDNILNDLLRDADLIRNHQVAVGVLVNALGETTSILTAGQADLFLRLCINGS